MKVELLLEVTVKSVVMGQNVKCPYTGHLVPCWGNVGKKWLLLEGPFEL